jgi:MoaA/NifB/PqqE/SkfB family radical SAM enzyme
VDEFAIDTNKVMYHPDRVAAWMEAGDDWERAKLVYPIYLEISPVGACNHRCTFCAVDYLGYKPNFLDSNILGDRFAEMAKLGVLSVMFAGEGEPLLHKRSGEMFASAREAGLDIALTTNAVLMDEKFVEQSLESFSWVKVSFNAGTPEGYGRIHQTKESDFHRVIANVKHAVAMKKKRNLDVAIGMQIVLLPENWDEVEELARICRDEIQPDYLVVKPYSQHPSSITRKYEGLKYEGFEGLAAKLESYRTSDFDVIVRAKTINKLSESRGYTRCGATPMMWGYLMSTGELWACSAHLGDDRFMLGNLHERSFQDIWEGEGRKRCFEYVTQELDISRCRVNCRMDDVNRFLADVAQPSAHVNFI